VKGTFKTALVAAVVASAITAGAAVATTQAFLLGTSNRVDAPTTVVNATSNGVTNPVDAPLLTLNNKSSTANATPLSLLAAPNHAAFKVNTGVKVANLNADEVDGLDATSFVQGRYQVVSNSIGIPSGGTGVLLASLPGLGELRASCATLPQHLSDITFVNTSGRSLAVMWSSGSTDLHWVAVSPQNNTLDFGFIHRRAMVVEIGANSASPEPVSHIETLDGGADSPGCAAHAWGLVAAP